MLTINRMPSISPGVIHSVSYPPTLHSWMSLSNPILSSAVLHHHIAIHRAGDGLPEAVLDHELQIQGKGPKGLAKAGFSVF